MENKTIPQPLDIINELRKMVRPLGMEVLGFNWVSGRINLELGTPMAHDPPTSTLWARLLKR